MSVIITGVENLYASLDKITESNIETALNKAALIVENDAKVHCPVDKGALRRSITHKVTVDKAEIGTNLEYAPYVEYGTGLFSSKGTGRGTPWSYEDASGKWHTTIGQHPQPFLIPALHNNRDEIIDTIRRELTNNA